MMDFNAVVGKLLSYILFNPIGVAESAFTEFDISPDFLPDDGDNKFAVVIVRGEAAINSLTRTYGEKKDPRVIPPEEMN